MGVVVLIIETLLLVGFSDTTGKLIIATLYFSV